MIFSGSVLSGCESQVLTDCSPFSSTGGIPSLLLLYSLSFAILGRRGVGGGRTFCKVSLNHFNGLIWANVFCSVFSSSRRLEFLLQEPELVQRFSCLWASAQVCVCQMPFILHTHTHTHTHYKELAHIIMRAGKS